MAAFADTNFAESEALDRLLPGWRQIVGDLAWRVFEGIPPEQELVTLTKWFVRVTVRVRDVRPLMVLLFGEPRVSA